MQILYFALAGCYCYCFPEGTQHLIPQSQSRLFASVDSNKYQIPAYHAGPWRQRSWHLWCQLGCLTISFLFQSSKLLPKQPACSLNSFRSACMQTHPTFEPITAAIANQMHDGRFSSHIQKNHAIRTRPLHVLSRPY